MTYLAHGKLRRSDSNARDDDEDDKNGYYHMCYPPFIV